MFQYQQTQRYFALAAGHTEPLAASELTELGATEVEAVYRGVYFNAEPAVLYRINYSARLITRVLAPLLTFDCHSDRYLYRTAGEIDWSSVFSVDETFAIFATVANSNISHSQFAAQRLKDAIVDQFRDRSGRRPSVRKPDPDVWINLRIDQNRAIISLDTSGGSLHRRGYRTASVEAPMQETVAAAVIRLSEWNGDTPLIDPMCGSGTLLAEALMHVANIPASYGRTAFGFEHLPDFDAALWNQTRDEANAAIRTVEPGIIGGSDQDPAAVSATLENLSNLPGGDAVYAMTTPMQEHPGLENGTIVCNPPYGVRMGDPAAVGDLYRAFGDWLKHGCRGSSAFLFAGKPELLKSVGLRTAWKKILVNGALEGRLAKYEMY